MCFKSLTSKVTVYTQFGYASVDLDKYKDDSHLSQITAAGASPHSSPEKPKQAAVAENEDHAGGGQMMLQNHDSLGSTSSSSGNGEKFIELNYKWGIGYI